MKLRSTARSAPPIILISLRFTHYYRRNSLHDATMMLLQINQLMIAAIPLSLGSVGVGRADERNVEFVRVPLLPSASRGELGRCTAAT
jgi:hypothetical protein